MKTAYRKIHDEIAAIRRGEKEAGRVWEVVPDGKGGFRRRAVDSKAFRSTQQEEWDRGIAATRHKLGLSQSDFARLLGISVRTLHNWEQGTRKPTGAARVLLRVAAEHPEVVLKAAA
jgi:putative transcriptional regulator